MSYKATVFNVMIASPSDVPEERSIIRKVVNKWNYIHSMSKKIVLIPISEETHTAPNMGDHPQKIINKQVVKRSDLVIGTFWTRIGTPTDEYPSGSVEEIEEHISSEKPTMLYFSKEPIPQDKIDLDQNSKLKEFKESCEKRGLYKEYDSTDKFKEELFDHICIMINTDDYFKAKDIIEEDDDTIQDESGEFPKLKISDLSPESKTLLIEASNDHNGQILKLSTIGKTLILQTNRKNLVEGNDPRIIAKWEKALQELLDYTLITEKGYEGKRFTVTDNGFNVADKLIRE